MKRFGDISVQQQGDKLMRRIKKNQPFLIASTRHDMFKAFRKNRKRINEALNDYLPFASFVQNFMLMGFGNMKIILLETSSDVSVTIQIPLKRTNSDWHQNLFINRNLEA